MATSKKLLGHLKSCEILGVRVDILKRQNYLNSILEELDVEKSLIKIFTINPEFLVDSFFDKKFKEVLNSGDFNSCDGIGVVMAVKIEELFSESNFFKAFLIFIKSYFRQEFSSSRLTGVEIVEQVLKYAEKNNKSVYFLGGSEGKRISDRMIEYCHINFPQLKAIGGSSSFSYQETDDVRTVKHLHEFMKVNSISEIDFLLVGYGHKRQEFWIDRNQSKIPARICVGVGGTFDFLTSEIKRAPKFFRDFGFEWLFRLFVQPSRVFRIFKATFLFLFLLILSKFFKK